MPDGDFCLARCAARHRRTGRGKIRVRGITNIETMPNGKSRIIVTELPYMVNKARLIEKIAELVRDKKVDGITDLSDQSSREGMRVCIELRRDVNPNIVLNQLYKHTYLHNPSFFLLYSRLLSICTPNGGRTRTTIPGQGILSPSCIPISPSEHLGITKGDATGVCT